jgi:hypothetical protein
VFKDELYPEFFLYPKDGPLHTLLHQVSCRPCGYAACIEGYQYLESLTVQQAVEAAKEVISI